MLRKPNDREVVLRLIQDLRVKARDITDFTEKRKIQKVINQFEKGLKEEYGG